MVKTMENSKTYDAFQHELEDYIRKQKARGLQPKICFRNVTEDSKYRERGHTGHKPPVLEQRLSIGRPYKFPGSYKRLRAVESQLPPWPKIHDSRQRMEYLSHHQKKQDHLFKAPALPSPAVQGKNSGPHRVQPREDSSFFSEVRTNTHQAGEKQSHQRRRYREKGEYIEEEQVLRKRKHHGDGESHKENRSISKRKAKVDPVSAEKLKHKKKNNKARDTTKEGRRSHREKKGPGRENTEERDLWDEAILGGCY